MAYGIRMRRRWLIAFLTLLGVACAVWLFSNFENREPLHKGKPVSYWVDRACTGYDGNEVWEFRREVQTIGPAAVPYLLDKLQTSDRWRNVWRSLRTHLPEHLQWRLRDVPSGKEIRYGAARTIAMLGPDARLAVPDLVRLLPEMNHPVIAALRAIGPDAKDALPALHTLLTNQDIALRLEIAGALWRIGRETNMVLQICTNAMVSGTESMNAGVYLSWLLTAAAPAVPFALNTLMETNNLVGTRANAATVLGAARVSSPEILSALLHGTQAGQDPNFRSNCAMALWRLNPQYAPLATRLIIEDIVLLKRRFPKNEQDFTKWLEFRDLDPRESLPTLKQLVESDSAEIRNEASEALMSIETKAKARTQQ